MTPGVRFLRNTMAGLYIQLEFGMVGDGTGAALYIHAVLARDTKRIARKNVTRNERNVDQPPWNAPLNQ